MENKRNAMVFGTPVFYSLEYKKIKEELSQYPKYSFMYAEFIKKRFIQSEENIKNSIYKAFYVDLMKEVLSPEEYILFKLEF